jgi:hypothetical protein
MKKGIAVIFLILIFCMPAFPVGAGESGNVKISFFGPERSKSRKSGYCKGTRVTRGDIQLIPQTIGEGMSIPGTKSHEERQRYFNRYFQKTMEYAEKAGVSVFKNMDDFFSVGTKDGWFFLLYYNLSRAEKCKRDYLIQRVKLSTGSYGKGGRKPYRGKTLYLVEVMKLNEERKTGRGDQHLRVYSLGGAFKRKIEVECEIGWGCIRGDLKGDEWPYGKTLLYRELQGYSERPGLYDKVRFEVSRKYLTVMEFDKEGRGRVQLPAFLRGGR